MVIFQKSVVELSTPTFLVFFFFGNWMTDNFQHNLNLN